jgi:hypothetical protein
LDWVGTDSRKEFSRRCWERSFWESRKVGREPEEMPEFVDVWMLCGQLDAALDRGRTPGWGTTGTGIYPGSLQAVVRHVP